MEVKLENENESECIEQRILKMRAEIVAIQKEIAEIRKESERRSAEMKAEIIEIREESERRTAKMNAGTDSILEEDENDALLQKIRQDIAETAEITKRNYEQIEGITEYLAMPEFRRIFDQHFNAKFLGLLKLNLKELDGPLKVDAWGVSRSGTKEVYLVEIKKEFRHEHFHQMRQLVKRFRSYFPTFSDSPIYTVIAAEKISDIDRRKLWEMGMYLIDITDYEFELMTPPAEVEFEPKGGYGRTKGVHGAVSPLGHLVWNCESEQQKLQ